MPGLRRKSRSRAGLGANVLVGGIEPDRGAAAGLVAGPVGLDVAAGIGALELHPRDELRCGCHSSGSAASRSGPRNCRRGAFAPLDQPRRRLKRWLRCPRPTGQRGKCMAANGKRRHARDGPPLYRAGRSVPERQDHAARGDPCAYRRDPAPGHRRGRQHGRRREQGSAPSPHERRALGRHHEFHGRHLHLPRLSRLGRVRP